MRHRCVTVFQLRSGLLAVNPPPESVNFGGEIYGGGYHSLKFLELSLIF